MATLAHRSVDVVITDPPYEAEAHTAQRMVARTGGRLECEPIACHAPGGSTWNGGGSHGVFIINKSGDPRTGHQTQKPVALMEKLVRLFSDPGELILDPFTGSGSTGVAALRLGRRFAGWEMNPEYAEMARRRPAAAREQLEIGF
jgi:site-specific DNA-methyltransferase (adenine-specific)